MRKRKFRNVKLKFRAQSETLLREIVSLTAKCKEAAESNMETDIKLAYPPVKEGSEKGEKKEAKETAPGEGKGDSLISPSKVAHVDFNQLNKN